MVDQRGQKVGFLAANKSFFKGYIDFLGYTSRSGYWFVMLPYSVLIVSLCLLLFGQLASVGLLSIFGQNGYNVNVMQVLASGVLSSIVNTTFVIVFFGSLLTVPACTLYVRRLRDAGLTDQFIAILFVISTTSSTVFGSVGNILGLMLAIINIVFLASKSDALKTDSDNAVLQFLFQKK